MSAVITVHRVGDVIYTLSDAGALLAWFVCEDGSLREVDVNTALNQKVSAE